MNKNGSKRYHNEFFQRKKYSLDNHIKSKNIFAQTNLRTLNQRIEQEANHHQINENSEFNLENLQNSKQSLRSKIKKFDAVDLNQKKISLQLKNEKIE